MPSLLDIEYIKHFHTLPSELYSEVMPQPLHKPKFVAGSKNCAQLLGLDIQTLQDDESLKLISGHGILNIWQPIAMKYTGHQFGQYNPQLGDGRGLLMAQVSCNQKIWDLHLKGAGSTPYSRQGDGRAVLRSSIREFLCSEAMAGLKIPTSRALCVMDSETQVYRETVETGAMVMRVSESHIRFGHFEFCSFNNPSELLKTLTDFVIRQHYPQLINKDDKYALFYKETVEKTAKLMAQWQSIGFCHGVMNTDNMSILGETFDYGPFAFLDDYNPNFICNHSDHQGRYAFNQQPNIANWNLSVLAQALLPLIDKEDLIKQLDNFPNIFETEYYALMLQKFGLLTLTEDKKVFIDASLKMLEACKLDYSYFFRGLSHVHLTDVYTELRNLSLDIKAFDKWYEQYQAVLLIDGQVEKFDVQANRAQRMNRVNPKYILRNYLAQNAIQMAQDGNYQEVQKLHDILMHPFSEQPEHEQYAKLPPDWGKKLEISCSS